MAELPKNPVVGETVLEDFDYIDTDSDAFMAARNEWITGGKVGPEPQPDSFLISLGVKTKVYFWNGLGWLQWVDGGKPVNVFIEE